MLAVRKNQPKLLEMATKAFTEPAEVPCFTTQDRGHVRQETRTYFIQPVPEAFRNGSMWQKLQSVVRVESICVTKDKTTTYTRYYIIGLASDQLAEISAKIHSHWSIESQLHWSLDVTFREDFQRTRRGWGAENLVILRRMSISAVISAFRTPVSVPFATRNFAPA